jgi:hypothetical protein
VGGPHLAVGVRDWVSLEAGSNLSFAGGETNWAMAWFGPRFTWAPHRDEPNFFAADLELGAGFGLGGSLRGNESPGAACDFTCPDGRHWSDRVAGGAYQGFGLGGHFHWFALYLRIRVEEAATTHVPTTFWPSAMLGMEFSLGRRAAFSLGGGFLGYFNNYENQPGWFYQLALTVFFGRGA